MGWVKNKGSLKKFQVGGKVPKIRPQEPLLGAGPNIPGPMGTEPGSKIPPVPLPIYEEGGKVTPYERNQAKRDAMKKRRAKAIAARKDKKAAKKADKASKKTVKADTPKVVKADTPKVVKADKPKKKRKPIGAKKVVETKGGDYPVYKKKSLKAKSFREKFAEERKKGSKEFEWKGRKYHTRTKEEESARKAKKAKSAATKKKRDEEFKKGAESSVSGTVYPPKRGT